MKFLKRIPYWQLLVLPYLAFAFGMLLNGIVIAVNHGQMPVLGCSTLWPDGMSAEDGVMQVHACMTHATHLKFLADWFVINHVGAASPGDFFIELYEWTTPYNLVIWLTLIIKKFLDMNQ